MKLVCDKKREIGLCKHAHMLVLSSDKRKDNPPEMVRAPNYLNVHYLHQSHNNQVLSPTPVEKKKRRKGRSYDMKGMVYLVTSGTCHKDSSPLATSRRRP